MKLQLNRYQDNLWRYANLFPEDYYNLGWSARLSANLKVDLFAKAFNYVVHTVELMHSVLLGDAKSGFYFEETDENQSVFEVISCSFDECQQDMERFTKRPFDLSHEWPIRARLYHLSDDSFILLIVFHHICIDGVTGLDFFSMLESVYNQLDADGNYPNLEIPSWEDSIHRMENGQRALSLIDLNNWRKTLSNEPLELFFPDVNNSTSYTVNFEMFELGESLMSRINHIARQNGVTAFIVILGAWMIVLSRFTGRKGIFVENSINMRTTKSKNLVGFFVNNIPLSVDFSNLVMVKDVFSVLAQQWKTLRTLRHYTWPELLSFLKRENPLNDLGRVNVGINFAGWSNSFNLSLSNVDCRFFRRLDHSSSLDLFLDVEPTKTGFSRINYHPIFSIEQIQMLIESLRTVLEVFVSDIERPLSSISMMPEEKQKQIMQSYENKLDSLPSVKESINDRFERLAALNPNKIAIVYDGSKMTYLTLSIQVNRNANCLRLVYQSHFHYELPLGEPIGIYTNNKCLAIIWMLSILKAGGAYVILDSSYPLERIAFLVQDYGIHCVLTDDKCAIGEKLPKDLFYIDIYNTEKAENNCPRIHPSSLAYIISTSGTTGHPKGVPIRHEQVLELVQSGVFVSDADQCVLQFASLCFDASVWEIFFTLLHGSTLVIATEEQRLDMNKLQDLLIEQQVTIALFPPAILPNFPHIAIPSLKKIWVAGETASRKEIDYWQTQCSVFNGYGPTETTVCASACQFDLETPSNDIGLPLPAVTCYVLDENQNMVPDFVCGELYIGGPQVASGYINRPEQNSVKFIPNPFATEKDYRLKRNLFLYRSGDIVSRLPNGHLLFHGRTDFQVKIHGFRIESGEIESILNQHPMILQCVVQVQTISNDKVLVAYILPKEESANLSELELKAYLLDYLPSYMIPTKWVFVTGFPMTVNGKIDLKSLPAPSLNEEFVEVDVVKATSVEERLLESIASEVLRMKQISVTTDLFDLGLTSIQVMMIVSGASSLGLELSASAFYRYRTIREIAKHKDASICFWHHEDKDKPIAVIVCGDTYFAPDYIQLADKLSDKYSVLVLESYHEYLLGNATTDWEQVLEAYLSIMQKVLDGRAPQLLSGFCLGGEMALGMASLLEKQSIQPDLLLIDSFVNRDKGLPIAMDYPGTSEIVNARRQEETNRLLQTQKLSSYEGDICIILANRFTTERMQLNDEALVAARRQFEENPVEWKRLYPQSSIEWRNAIHWDILKNL